MKILQTNVTPHEGGIGGYTVEFVYEDENHLSVNLRDKDAEDYNELDVIRRAKALLDHADASGVRGDMPAYDLIATKLLTRVQRTRRERRQQLSSGPESNVDVPDENANMVAVNGEGMIELKPPCTLIRTQ